VSFGLTNREGIPPTTLSAFDNLTSSLQGVWAAEHNLDGSHGAVTAESIDLRGAQVGGWVDLPYSATRFQTQGIGVWTVTATNQAYLKAMRIGEAVWVMFQIEGSTITIDTSSLLIWLPEFTGFQVGRPASPSTPYVGGIANWIDRAGFTSGLTSVTAYAQPPAVANGKSRTVLSIDKFGPVNATFGQFPITANFDLVGSCWFPVTTANEATTFSFT